MKTYLETAKSPGIAGNLMAGYAVLCGVVFNTGVMPVLFSEESPWEPWRQSVLWAFPFILAAAMAAWVRKRPIRSFSADPRVWYVGFLGTAGQAMEALLADVRAFVGPAPQHDDLTLVVVRITP